VRLKNNDADIHDNANRIGNEKSTHFLPFLFSFNLGEGDLHAVQRGLDIAFLERQ
jgi:hypothetical protein